LSGKIEGMGSVINWNNQDMQRSYRVLPDCIYLSNFGDNCTSASPKTKCSSSIVISGFYKITSIYEPFQPLDKVNITSMGMYTRYGQVL